MILWIDAQLSPHLALWLRDHFAVEAFSAQRLGLITADDAEIFQRAREVDAVILTKDQDFLRLLAEQGPPPRVIWVTAGNTSTEAMKALLQKALPTALDLLETGESLVEISDPTKH